MHQGSFNIKSMKIHLKNLLLLVSILYLIILSGCVRSANPDIERGTMFQFEEGFPEVRTASIGLLSPDDKALINVTTDVVLGSLIYSTEDEKRFAEISIEIRVTEEDGDYSETVKRDYQVESDFDGSYISQEVFTNEEEIEVKPGNFQVAVTVLDKSSGKQTVRTSESSIPDPNDPEISLTTVRLLAKNISERTKTDFFPITTYTVPSKLDSLKFEFQITNNDLEDPLTVNSKLLKFPADMDPARPMNYNNYSPSSLPYIGVDMRKSEEIDSNTRRLEEPGSVLIEFKYELLERGNYRFEVETTDEDGDRIYKARDFSIQSESYPNIQTPRELADPLIYLMDRKDHRRMMEIEDPDSLKEAVDRFWLSHIRNTSKARSVINLYYERVEEANKQFSTFKEGWKTDLGMIYILFGPPWYVDRYLNTMHWSYSYDRTDPRYNFSFERPTMNNEFFPFDNYLLQRHQEYFNIQYRQIQLWLSGSILENRL